MVFFQGCALRCRFCHNPDTWDIGGGEVYTVSQVMAKIRRYRPYFAATGGGITFSGGEPALQLPFLSELMATCHAAGIHTALDTAGWATPAAMEPLLPNLDLVLLDMKHMDETRHRWLCGQSNWPGLTLARYLAAKGIPLWIRQVIVPGYTDDSDNLARLVEFCRNLPSLQRIELLPYHRLGEHKWAALGMEYSLKQVQPPTAARMEDLRRLLASAGLGAEVA